MQISFDETELLRVQELLRDHQTALEYLQVTNVSIEIQLSQMATQVHILVSRDF